MAMLIMGILLTMIVATMVHLFTPTLQAEAIRDSSDQLDIAFMQLDSQVAYASQIWAPYQGVPGSDDDWDIEYESTFSGAQEPTCTELKYQFGAGELLEAVVDRRLHHGAFVQNAGRRPYRQCRPVPGCPELLL